MPRLSGCAKLGKIMEKSKRGGARPGAGRKPSGIKTHTMTLRIPEELYQQLGTYGSRSQLIIEAIKEKLGKMNES